MLGLIHLCYSGMLNHMWTCIQDSKHNPLKTSTGYTIYWKSPTFRKPENPSLYLDYNLKAKYSHILGRKDSMQEVCGQTQRRYICHESDVIMWVCDNMRQFLKDRTSLTGNTDTSSICNLQQICPNIVLSSSR